MSGVDEYIDLEGKFVRVSAEEYKMLLRLKEIANEIALAAEDEQDHTGSVDVGDFDRELLGQLWDQLAEINEFEGIEV